MNVRERFKEEICYTCEAYPKCECSLEKQAQCATLANYFNIKRLLKRSS